MKINPISENKSITPNFQKGLTKSFVLKAKELDCEKAKKILKQKGIKSINLGGYQSIAASCLATAEIIKSFGFSIPKNFSYKSIPENYVDGNYTYPDDIVCINSRFTRFRDLLAQDDFETYRKGSPITKHFLATYIHEFMHAAHFKHLAVKYSYDEFINICNELKQYAPAEELLNPKVTKPTWKNWEVKDWNGSILGDYAGKDLIEFFAENASFEIARILEKNPLGENRGKNLFFNPKRTQKLSLSFLEEKKDNFWTRMFNKKEDDRIAFLRAIWDGDLDTIFSEKYSKYIRKSESIQ
ncbi:MAG: hypothetical protein E7Z92_03075 [Cyanobacteria bacterium SIG31]|nr:hypothetical protein [Cyanobacteria bacterium SIG31]